MSDIQALNRSQAPQPLGEVAATSKAGKPQAEDSPLAKLVSVALPDAVVYTNSLLNKANTRNFFLANPLTGSYTHFIGHKNAPSVEFMGQTWKRVEAVHYDATGKGTRREDGLGFSIQNQAKTGTFFMNARVGDTNAIDPRNGVSVNAGFFGKPEALRGMAEQMQRSGNVRVREVGVALGKLMDAAAATGTELGLAWRGQLVYNNKTQKAQLVVSGVTFDLADLKQAMATVKPVNQGSKDVARANNIEAYLKGANPYDLAMQTRAPGGAYVNHGDPVSDVAGRIQKLNEWVNPGAGPVRTNAQAGKVLEEALARAVTLTPEQIRQLTPEDRAQLPPNPLSIEQSREVFATLALIQRNGLAGLYGSAKVSEAAAAVGGKSPTPLPNAQFVRDVFEGDFRRDPAAGYDAGDFLRDLTLGLSRAGQVLAGLDAGGTANEEQIMQRNRAATAGLGERLNAQEGGVLKALRIDTQGLADSQRASMSNDALQALAYALRGLAYEAKREPTGQGLYDTFRKLSEADRNAIGARINAALRRP
jgi:hypothetical protein